MIDGESVADDEDTKSTAADVSIISGVMGRDPNPGRVHDEKPSPVAGGGLLLLIHLLTGRLLLVLMTSLHLSL